MNQRTRIIALFVAIALIIGGFILVSSNEAEAASQEAVADAHVLLKTPTQNTGTEQSLVTRGLGTTETWALMKFTGVPAGSATLTVRVTISASATLTLRATDNAWVENTVNWNNKPVAGAVLDTKPSAVGSIVFNTGPLDGGDESFYIQSSNGSKNIFISSREHPSNPGPTLTYGSPPPTTTTVAPTTTTIPPPSCPDVSTYASPQAAVNAQAAGGCLDVNGLFSLSTDPGLVLNKAITLNCVDTTQGFTATSAPVFMIRITANGVRINNCLLDGNDASGSGPYAVHLAPASGATLADTRLVGVLAREVINCVTTGGNVTDFWFTDGVCETTHAAGFGFYAYSGNTHSYVHILRSTVRNNQLSNGVGQAGIQTGAPDTGESISRNSFFELVGNTLSNDTCPVGSGRVMIGLDQISNSTITDNTITHPCSGGGESIVANGPFNQILRNRLNHGARIILISYPGPWNSNHDNLVKCNVGFGDGANQGLAFSWGAGGEPAHHVVVTDNDFTGYGHGIQSYTYLDPPNAPGPGNEFHRNDLVGNGTPYSLPGFTYTGTVTGTPVC